MGWRSRKGEWDGKEERKSRVRWDGEERRVG